MSIKRGVVTAFTSDSARPIRAKSTIPIGIVVTSKNQIATGVYGYDGLDEALIDMDTMGVTLEDGTALKYLKLGDLFNVTAPIVLSVIQPVDSDEAETKTRVLNAISELKTAPSKTGYKPDIIVAPEFGYDVDIANALISVCDKFKARTFYDLYANDNADAISKRGAFGSDRITLIKTGGIVNNIDYDGGMLMGWERVRTDASSTIGFSKSISNRVLPISAVRSPSDFFPGQLDETDPLTEAQISSIIFYKGFRLWEYSTASEDAIKQDARRVRIFDMASEAVLDGIFYAIDKGISELKSAKKTLRAFMSDLVGAEVVLGFTIELDTQKTTATAITNGEFYFKIDAQEMPSPRLIKVTFNRVDRYSDKLYEILATA